MQNSEFLKRTALVLHYHGTGIRYCQRLRLFFFVGLWAISGQTKKLLSLVKEFITELRWGLDFQKNRVLGEKNRIVSIKALLVLTEASPVRPPSSSPPSPPSKQQLVSSEMHHADLHAVAALTR